MRALRRLFNTFSNAQFLVFSRALGVKGATLGLNATLVLILPRIIGAEIYSVYAILMAAMNLAIGTFRGPLEILMQRSYQPVADAQSQRTNETRFVTFYALAALHRLVLVSALACCGLFVVTVFLSNAPLSPIAMVAPAIACAIGVLSSVRRGRLIVSGQTDRVDILDLLVRPALFLALTCLYQALFGVFAPTLSILLGVSYLVALAGPNLSALRADIRLTAGGQTSARKDWVKLVSSAGLSALGKNLDVLLIGSLVGGTAAGSYMILARIADLLAFGNNYANLRFTHRFAKACREGSLDHARAIVRAATRLSSRVAALGAIPALLLGPFLLPRIQPELADYYLPFAILVCAQLINGLFGPRGAFLSSQRPGLALTLKSVNTGIGIIILYFATKSFGIQGAAAAMACSVVSSNFISAIAFRSVLTSILERETR